MSAYVSRPLRESDLPAVLELRALAGPGFTSLAVGEAVLAERLAESEASFADGVAPGQGRFILGLEHVETGVLAGMAAVKAQVGVAQPFFNFRLLRIAQHSAAARRRFDLEVLVLVNEYAGASEVGSLFVRAEHRGGAGRALAQTRYMLIAADPGRFSEVIVSELRGVVEPDGRSPFWEALGRHFFRMEFAEADALSAAGDNQFILDLMPKYPIYVDLLPQAAREAIGQPHPEGVGARRLLLEEGFRYDRVVDIFDGGPLVSTARDALRTVREARRLPITVSDSLEGRRALIATTQIDTFRCAPGEARYRAGRVVVPPAMARSLDLVSGDKVLAWVSDG